MRHCLCQKEVILHCLRSSAKEILTGGGGGRKQSCLTRTGIKREEYYEVPTTETTRSKSKVITSSIESQKRGKTDGETCKKKQENKGKGKNYQQKRERGSQHTEKQYLHQLKGKTFMEDAVNPGSS